MQTLKQAVGIDVSKDELVACFGSLNTELRHNISSAASFKNNPAGFKALLTWVNKHADSNLSVWFVMEATGVYYENLAHFLADKDFDLTVLLPNKIKSYMRTLDNKSKTDNLDAYAITLFGLEKTLRKWRKPDNLFKKLKELTREYTNIKSQAAQAKNRVHAKEHSYKPAPETLKRIKEQIKLYNKQLKEIQNQIKELIKQDADLYTKINNIQKIEGVGLMTIVTILAETNGFELIESGKQLTSYAGIDIVHNQSGYKTGKTRISKKGNNFLRKALYMPALSAAKHNEKLKEIYIRLVIRKNIKKIAVIAIMRKLLLLIYTLWKHDAEYIPNYKTI
ncbi:MAG: IS110 family transposase [Ignavibacteria bacterium]|nr:IS110 family transposase [Ignavibacteria bacterium]